MKKINIADLLPMEALPVATLPEGAEWRYEPKWDGFRCLAYKDGADIHLISKSGKPLNRYFPDIVAVLSDVKCARFLVDGEIVIETKEGYCFADLQLRLHPAASRVAKLAADTPASYVLFDFLVDEKGKDYFNSEFSARRKLLEKFHEKYIKSAHLPLSQQTENLKEAQKWLSSHKARIDGIVAKNISDTYRSGERVMRKYKAAKTADCVVGGFRYGTGTKKVASLLLGLYDDEGNLNHVGFTSSMKDLDKEALTRRLEALMEEPGFTGKAPGGPSRWSTGRSADWQPLRPELVVEVKYDHVSGGRFRHGTKFLRWRPDKKPMQCKMEQMQR